MYALNAATGAIITQLHTRGDVWSSPIVVNGMVFVGSGDGFLYAFGLP